MASLFVERLRKPLAALGFGIRSTVTQADADVPQIVSGTGVPSVTLPNGSLFTRTDAADADNSLYQRIGGAWVALKGQTA